MNLKISDSLQAKCKSQGNNKGFVHIAELLRDNQRIARVVLQYYNRTWERYTFESALSSLLNKAKGELTFDEQAIFGNVIAR